MVDKNLYQTIKMTEDANGKITFAPDTIYGKIAHWDEAEGLEVVGDAAATGTTIVSLSIPALTRFACMSLTASTNIAAVLSISSGTLAAHVDIYNVDLQAAGSLVLITEDTPIFVYNNTTAAAVTLLMIAPLTAMGAGTNNDANHYFNGHMGGVLM